MYNNQQFDVCVYLKMGDPPKRTISVGKLINQCFSSLFGIFGMMFLYQKGNGGLYHCDPNHWWIHWCTKSSTIPEGIKNSAIDGNEGTVNPEHFTILTSCEVNHRLSVRNKSLAKIRKKSGGPAPMFRHDFSCHMKSMEYSQCL